MVTEDRLLMLMRTLTVGVQVIFLGLIVRL